MRRGVAALAAVVLLGGCGFAGSGERGSNKPDGFTLRGYVSVGVSGAPSGQAAASGPASASVASGTGTCEAPAAATDVHAGGAVRIADPEGHTLAAGQLAPGVPDVGRCNFGFQITNVPGGVDRYVIGVGNRPTEAFPARDLRSDKPAVILVNV